MAADPRSPKSNALGETRGMVSRAIAGVMAPELEALPGLAITPTEREALSKMHGKLGDNARYPIEWVIDVADNSLNWFIATAYEYDDSTQRLVVAIPDRDEPQWEGELPLDQRMIHLIECCDEHSAALYKWIVGASTIRVSWRIEMMLTDVWQDGVASWLGELSNVVYVERQGGLLEELGIDENLKLGEVIKSSNNNSNGEREFERLLRDGLVQAVGADLDPGVAVGQKPSRALRPNLDILERLAEEMAACMRDTLRMRSVASVEQTAVSKLLKDHVLKGDQDALARITENADRDATVLQRRAEHVEETEAFVGRCEARFWRAAASGLFFRRRYDLGELVEVVLCRGLKSATGRVAKIHENDTYDVDLDTGISAEEAARSYATNSNNGAEVGVQIPPEYLRPQRSNKKSPPAELKSSVEELWRVRDSLRSELEGLARERDKIEQDHRGQRSQLSPRREADPPRPPMSEERSEREDSSSSQPPVLSPEHFDRRKPSPKAPLRVLVGTTSLTELLPEAAETYDLIVIALADSEAAFDDSELCSLAAVDTCSVFENEGRRLCVAGSAVENAVVDFYPTKRGCSVILKFGDDDDDDETTLAFATAGAASSSDDAADVLAECLDDTDFADAARDAEHAFLLLDWNCALDIDLEDPRLENGDWAELAGDADQLTRAHASSRGLRGWTLPSPVEKPLLTNEKLMWRERLAYKSLPGLEQQVQMQKLRMQGSALVAALIIDPKPEKSQPTDFSLDSLRVTGLGAEHVGKQLRLEVHSKSTSIVKSGDDVEWPDELPCRALSEHLTLRVFQHEGNDCTMIGAATLSMRLCLSTIEDEPLLKNGRLVAKFSARLNLELGEPEEQPAKATSPSEGPGSNGKTKKKSMFKSMFGRKKK